MTTSTTARSRRSSSRPSIRREFERECAWLVRALRPIERRFDAGRFDARRPQAEAARFVRLFERLVVRRGVAWIWDRMTGCIALMGDPRHRALMERMLARMADDRSHLHHPDARRLASYFALLDSSLPGLVAVALAKARWNDVLRMEQVIKTGALVRDARSKRREIRSDALRELVLHVANFLYEPYVNVLFYAERVHRIIPGLMTTKFGTRLANVVAWTTPALAGLVDPDVAHVRNAAAHALPGWTYHVETDTVALADGTWTKTYSTSALLRLVGVWRRQIKAAEAAVAHYVQALASRQFVAARALDAWAAWGTASAAEREQIAAETSRTLKALQDPLRARLQKMGWKTATNR